MPDHPNSRTLYISVMCSDYVTHFSPCKAAFAWNTICESILTSETVPNTSDLVKLLETANELTPFAKY